MTLFSQGVLKGAVKQKKESGGGGGFVLQSASGQREVIKVDFSKIALVWLTQHDNILENATK